MDIMIYNRNGYQKKRGIALGRMPERDMWCDIHLCRLITDTATNKNGLGSICSGPYDERSNMNTMHMLHIAEAGNSRNLIITIIFV